MENLTNNKKADKSFTKATVTKIFIGKLEMSANFASGSCPMDISVLVNSKKRLPSGSPDGKEDSSDSEDFYDDAVDGGGAGGGVDVNGRVPL